MAPNTRGRDFVVGDLHGHRAMLDEVLAAAGFDVRRDRLFSVGDLVDRGPSSLDTLALIEQPWFHAVLGNHELLLLNYLGFFDSRVHARRSYPNGAGEWVQRAQSRQRALLWRLAEQLTRLPLARHVPAALPFNVMHGDMAPLGFSQQRLLGPHSVCVHFAERAVASRDNLGGAPRRAGGALAFRERRVQLSARPLAALPLTYVGHSRLPEVTVHHSHVYVDQGVSDRREQRRLPTLLEHQSFALWLQGVGSARRDPLALPAESLPA